MGKHARKSLNTGDPAPRVTNGRLKPVQHDVEQQWLQALHWVMTQPGLIEGLPGGHQPLMDPDDVRLARLLAQNNQGLKKLLDGPRTHKVGIAFEALILWGIEQGLGYTCLGRDIQIQDGKRTMGALDLVVRAPDGAIEHWELAYKLFLQSDDGTGWSSWLGPRGRDRLDTKLQKMLNHQLPMSETPQAESALKRLGVERIDRHRLMMQGTLFSPWGSHPQRAVQGHQDAQGRWLRPSQLPELVQAHPNSTWVQRQEPLWFGSAPRTESTAAIPSQKMATEAGTAAINTPQLWTQIINSNPSFDRMYFVVHEDWPATSAHASESAPDTK